MSSGVQPVDVRALRIQRVGDDLVGSAVISNAMQHHDHTAIPGRTGRPVAIEKPSLVGGGNESVPVGDLAGKMRDILGELTSGGIGASI